MTPPPLSPSTRLISAELDSRSLQISLPSFALENISRSPWASLYARHPLGAMVRSRLDRAASLQATVNGWMRALAMRDDDTLRHTHRVAALAVRLARAMQLSEDQVQIIRWGALLHDIGKMSIPDRILLKPGPLEAEDWLVMQQHPTIAIDMLRSVPYLDGVLDIPYCHHERWDGSGYPRGLSQDDIPLSARIFSVVDVWDALGSPRPYRPAWPRNRALEYIAFQSDRQFDPQVIQSFFSMSNSERAAD